MGTPPESRSAARRIAVRDAPALRARWRGSTTGTGGISMIRRSDVAAFACAPVRRAMKRVGSRRSRLDPTSVIG